jgi:hypothetical protein
MVNRRLIWVLESRNLLSGAQCGFQHHRSALDHLVYLEYHTQNAFLLRQHLVAFVFDLQKAYDTPGGAVFSEPFIAGISGVAYHCLFLTSSRPEIASGSGIFCLRVIPKKMECYKDRF